MSNLILELINQLERIKADIQKVDDERLKKDLTDLYGHRCKLYRKAFKELELELSRLTVKEQYILRMSLIEGLTTENIAEKIHYSYRHANRLLSETKAKITNPIVKRLFIEERNK